ncbi:hypothetical protein FNF27_02161 [Cafeteria roenbergensis]|uniref:ParB/Sulfiredoxin domain-containing protein n=1 Tax=Cafeteria roenbergensis TaxID=33653 RepID=A0A5A8EF04_CAFRO|nr:hypothetical protein FNF27_02161 [Cafeteria roenbergensis]
MMKIAMALTVLVASAAWAKTTPSDFPACGSHPSVRSLCSIDVTSSRIRPTQALVGMEEIRCKTARYASMGSSDLQKYWGKHIVPAVVGIEGDLFITDHHHSALALWLADRKSDDRLVVLNITDDLSASPTLGLFWTAMLERDLLWLFDDKDGAPMHPNLLPTKLTRMVNDPYRSLVWGVRNNGGYGAVEGSSYQDFLYAQFLRGYNLLPAAGGASVAAGSALRGAKGNRAVGAARWAYCAAAPFDDELCYTAESSAIGAALGQAIALSQSAAAQPLPGWGTGTVDYPDCGNTTASASV